MYVDDAAQRHSRKVILYVESQRERHIYKDHSSPITNSTLHDTFLIKEDNIEVLIRLIGKFRNWNRRRKV